MSSSKNILKMLESGLAYHQAGLLEQAENAYRSVLQKKPKNPDALNLLGVIAHQKGKHETAIKFIKKAITNNQNVADFHNNCGEAYRALGQHKSAIKYFEKAISIQPNNVDAYNNLGLSFTELDIFDKAISCFEKALTFTPNDVEILANMGRPLSKLGKYEDAINFYTKAIKLKPDFIDIYINLGMLFNSLKRYDEAIEIYKKALTIKDDNPHIYYLLGLCLYDYKRIEEAISSFEQSLSLKPSNAAVHNSLGLIFNNVGEFEKASMHYEQALLIKPDYVDALYNLVLLNPKQEYITLIEERLKDIETSEAEKTVCHYALGIIFEKNKLYDQTFNHYLKANSLKRKTITYSSEDTSIYIEKLISVYTKQYFEKIAGKNHSETELPVFILGMPRSGTSLVEQIVSSHPKVYGAGELESIRLLEKTIDKHFTQTKSYPECMSLCDDFFLDNLTQKYLTEITGYSSSSIRITDKMPGNFLRIGLIKTLFPKARIIYCRRNAMDNCVSIFLNYLVHGNEFSFDLIELGKYYLAHEKLMQHWHTLFPSEIYEVQYEKLVTNQEHISKDLIKYLELEWNEQCLEFHKNKRDVKTASNLQVRQPIYTNSISRWKSYERHLEPLKEILKDYI